MIVSSCFSLRYVEASPSISSFDVSPKLDSTSQCVPVDGGFSLKCFAHGFPSPSIELVSPASTRGFVAHEGEAVYKITKDSPNGTYVCRVANACGNASEVYHLCTTPTTGGVHMVFSVGQRLPFLRLLVHLHRCSCCSTYYWSCRHRKSINHSRIQVSISLYC